LANETDVTTETRRIVAGLLWEVGAIHISPGEPFQLVSGNFSPLYIDCRLLISYPPARDLVTSIAHRLCSGTRLDTDYIAGGETAGIPYAAWLAERMGKPLIYVRKKPKAHGRGDQIEGYLKPGSTVLLYEDLVTDGKSKLSFARGIRAAQAVVTDCLTVFDRQQGGAEQLAAESLALHSMTDLETALGYGVEKRYLTAVDLDSIRNYLCDPRSWHAKRGYDYSG
jgi:orotate phosphoribosyltransferase